MEAESRQPRGWGAAGGAAGEAAELEPYPLTLPGPAEPESQGPLHPNSPSPEHLSRPWRHTPPPLCKPLRLSKQLLLSVPQFPHLCTEAAMRSGGRLRTDSSWQALLLFIMHLADFTLTSCFLKPRVMFFTPPGGHHGLVHCEERGGPQWDSLPLGCT